MGYYDISSTLEHLLFLAPSPWPELASVELGPDITAHWLLAVPIAESEYKLLLDIGLDEFETVFEQLDVPYFDLDREPAA